MTLDFVKTFDDGTEAIIRIDTDSQMEDFEITTQFPLDLETMFIAAPNADPLSGKMISVAKYLADLAYADFQKQFGSYEALRKDGE